jgi:hypothetical protein
MTSADIFFPWWEIFSEIYTLGKCLKKEKKRGECFRKRERLKDKGKMESERVK